jgi:DNA-directed RNA polymerase subunit beta'
VLNTNPQEQFEEIKQQLLKQVGSTFPIRDAKGRFEVRVKDLSVTDEKGVDDIRGQLGARLEGKTWGAPVTGTVEIVDSDGKVLVTKPNTRLAEIPKLTRQYSYIVDGKEKSVTNQWRLKPGAYVKATEKEGNFEAQFQLAKGKSFDVQMDPGTGYMYAAMGTRKIPLYSILQASGVSDDQMRKAWGDQNFEANLKKAKPEKDLASFYTASGKGTPTGKEDLKEELQRYYAGTKMDPEVTRNTLGKEFDQVNGESLFLASKKLLKVSAGKTRPDPMDALQYKELWTDKDHFAERLNASSNEIHMRVRKSLGKPTVQKALLAGKTKAIRDVVMPDLIQKPLLHVFGTSLASNSNQTNPLSMLSDKSQVTIKGPGGIQNEHAISNQNTALDPSQLGYVDPVYTPESDPGTVLHLAAGTKIKDRKPHTTMYNLRTGKIEAVPPDVAARSTVVLPDQIKWSKGKPSPTGKMVRVSDNKGSIRDVDFGKADYTLVDPSQVFSIESNLVPFIQNDSAHRSTMSARHMTQAISVTGREEPKVQVTSSPGNTFEGEVTKRFLAHTAPTAGTIEKVEKDHVVIRGKDGKKQEVDLYDHYPLNDPKAMLHSTPLVKAGDKVTQGQTLAENNYTKKGKLALGANLRTAYLANGSNHEDGLVISESGAKKLTSEHLYKPSLLTTSQTVVGRDKFRAHKPNAFKVAQTKAIGEDGFVKPGTVVEKGDPLVLALDPETNPDSIDSKIMERLSKKTRLDYKNSSLAWNHEHPGEVVRVVKGGKNQVVHVKTKEPVVVGSKVSTRHSAKGIVAQILPDEEMPRDAKDAPVDLLINPVGVPGRLNSGQILETVAGKIAEKTGKPYEVKNFDGNTDYLAKVKKELKDHGLKETETLYDPKTGRKLGDVTVGPHYAMQLSHQIDKKSHVRHGGFYVKGLSPHIRYDQNKVPRGGGEGGAQSLGALGAYAALASGLKDNLREMQTWKSDQPQAEAVWDSLQKGELVPPPQVPFVYKKFESQMKSIGLNLDKQGSHLRLIPNTDEEVEALSRGEVTRPDLAVIAKNVKPEKGGIFDTRIFGGQNGRHWGHIKLVEPMPNPVFAKPVAQLLNIKPDEIEQVISGKKKLPKYGTGPKALQEALKAINVDDAMKKVQTQLKDPKVKGTALNTANSLHKTLTMLKETKKTPEKAFMLRNMPVMPPLFRPFTASPDKVDRIDPLNNLYRRLGQVNVSLKDSDKAEVPYDLTLKNRGDLYKEMQNLFGTTPKGKKAFDIDVRGTREIKDRTLPGVLHTVAGSSPKDGFFQDKLIGKKQDYTSRATIVADPGLGPDEVGVPKKIAVEMYRPFVTKHLVRTGLSPFEAQEHIQKRSPRALSALEKVVENHPVLMKRDPVLHAYGLVGQNVKLTNSPAIKVSPLILPPIGGDVDGDQVALMLPLSEEAKQEVRSITPSQRPLSDATGDVLFQPANESMLGLYRSTLPRGRKPHKFLSMKDAEKAFRQNKVDLNDVVSIGADRTTLGRARIAQVVPSKFKQSVLTDLKKPFGKKEMHEVLKWTATQKPKHFAETASRLSQLGFKMAYESGHSVTLKDLEPLRDVRKKIVDRAKKEVQGLKGPRASQKATQVYLGATKELHDAYGEYYDKHPTNISDMVRGGIKAKKPQFQGLVMAPMLVQDHRGKPSKVPVTRSFAEGIGVGDYWMQAQGARRGVIQKVDEVSEPGYWTKMMVQVNIDQAVTDEDCKTKNGIMMPLTNRDVVDRHLASPVRVGKKVLPSGTAVTPDIQRALAKTKVKSVAVRSPLKCRMPQGVCGVCMGRHPTGQHHTVGENVGLVAAQTLGERAAQLMLRQTHGGGIVTTDKKVVDDFDSVRDLFAMRKQRSPSQAPIVGRDGRITSVEPQKQGGWSIHTSASKKPMYSRQKPLEHVRPGYQFKKGEQLTQGDPNMHDLLKTRGVEAVQDHMVKRIGGIYAGEGIKQRHVELAVRSSTGLVRVDDPGDHPNIVRGDYLQKQVVDEINRNVLKGKKPIRAGVVLKNISEIPGYRQKDWMGRMMTKNLAQVVTTAAQQGQKSRLHGLHPIPGLAYGAEFGRGKGPAGY